MKLLSTLLFANLATKNRMRIPVGSRPTLMQLHTTYTVTHLLSDIGDYMAT